MMSKKRATQTNRQSTTASQAEFDRGLKMIIPGLLVAVMAFLAIVNWIGAPTQRVYASVGEESQTGVSDTAEPVALPSSNSPAESQPQACTIGSRYPESIRQWCALIEGAAARYGLEADLLAAVMLQESGGNSQAYSSSGAVGLMQVMPRDGIAAEFMCQNGPCFARRPTMNELFDPAFNVDYGARMLSGLIERTGSVREALFAYGPMDVGYHYADLVLTIQENYR